MRWCLIIGSALAVLGGAVHAQSQTNVAEVTDQKFINVRANIYRKRFRQVERDGWGAYLKLRASVGLFEFETVDELLARGRESIGTVELRPSVEFEFPIGFLEHVYLVPRQDIGFVRETWRQTQYVSSLTMLKLRYFQPGEFEDLSVAVGMEYGTRYSEDVISVNDHVAATLEATTRHALGFSMGRYRVMVSPYGKMTHYIDGLDIEAPGGALSQITERYEVGAKFGTDPPYKIWKITIPQVRITYDFSGEVSGVRIKVGG
jgi:hypothetical protein